MIEWDNGMMAYFFWDEAGMKQGYWENKEDAQEALENHEHESNKELSQLGRSDCKEQ